MSYADQIKKAAGPCVIVVRHGTTAFNDKGDKDHESHKIRGWQNVPLDPEGREQAVQIAKALEDYPIAKVYCSDLDRAIDTGEAIAARAHCQVDPDRALRPWDLGDFTGKPVKDAVPHIVHGTKNEDETIPGGEPFRRYRLRFLGELTRILDRARENSATLCVVTHSRGMQATRAWLTAGCPDDLHVDVDTMNSYENELPTASAIALTPDGDCWKGEVVATEGERTGPTS